MKLKTQILEIPEAERTKPYGEILRFKKRFDTKDVKEFNYFLKEWVVTHEMIDESTIIANDYSSIPNGHCIECKNKINSYLKKYYEKHYDSCGPWSVELSEGTGYCEECASRLSSKATVITGWPHIVKTEQHYRDGEIVDVQLFSDGSTVEDMTVLEKN